MPAASISADGTVHLLKPGTANIGGGGRQPAPGAVLLGPPTPAQPISPFVWVALGLILLLAVKGKR